MVKDRLQLELEHYYGYFRDNFVRYTHRLRVDRIKALISDLAGDGHRQRKALDAGCSHGVYSILLAESGFTVLGIDINNEEVERARTWARNRGLNALVEFQVGDIQAINSADSSFDLVVCSEVLEHIDNPSSGAKELYRVLRPGGRLIMSMPNMGSLFGLLQWSYRRSGLRAALGRPPLDAFQIQHSRYWFGNILKMLKQTGFHVEAVHSTSHVPFLWEVDAFLGARSERMGALACRFDMAMSSLPVLKYLGFSFIVIASKLS